MAEGAETGVEMRNREEDLDDEMGDLVDESGDEVYGLLHSLLSTNSHLGRVFFCLSRCDFATGRGHRGLVITGARRATSC